MKHTYRTAYREDDQRSFLKIYLTPDIFFTIQATIDYEYERTIVCDYTHGIFDIYFKDLEICLSDMEDDELFQLSTVWDYPVPIELVRQAHKMMVSIVKEYQVNQYYDRNNHLIEFEY